MTRRAAARIWIIPPLLALAALCCYGLLASLEPGVGPAWRIAYAVGLVLCLGAAVLTWVWTRRGGD